MCVCVCVDASAHRGALRARSNVRSQGHLLSGSDDAQICLWDVAVGTKAKALDALHIYNGHAAVARRTPAPPLTPRTSARQRGGAG